MNSLIPYIGGKHRMARHILPHLVRPGIDTLVDAFGGSGAVTLAARDHFAKRIYNEISGDLCNLFDVLRKPLCRRELLRKLRLMPPSRELWDRYGEIWFANGFSFASVADPVERAALTFYRHQYAFGGKARSGGLSVSTGDRHGIKEIVRYRNTLRKLHKLCVFFGETFIENLRAEEIISLYGDRENAAIYCDPPYFGTERYYSNYFEPWRHAVLAEALNKCKAHAVVSYYDDPHIRSLYPDDAWDWHEVVATKNAQFRQGNRAATEVIIVKRTSTR